MVSDRDLQSSSPAHEIRPIVRMHVKRLNSAISLSLSLSLFRSPSGFRFLFHCMSLFLLSLFSPSLSFFKLLCPVLSLVLSFSYTLCGIGWEFRVGPVNVPVRQSHLVGDGVGTPHLLPGAISGYPLAVWHARPRGERCVQNEFYLTKQSPIRTRKGRWMMANKSRILKKWVRVTCHAVPACTPVNSSRHANILTRFPK